MARLDLSGNPLGLEGGAALVRSLSRGGRRDCECVLERCSFRKWKGAAAARHGNPTGWYPARHGNPTARQPHGTVIPHRTRAPLAREGEGQPDGVLRCGQYPLVRRRYLSHGNGV